MSFADSSSRPNRDRSRSPERNRSYGESDVYRPKTMDYRDRSPVNGGHYADQGRDYGSNSDSRFLSERGPNRMQAGAGGSDQARRVYVGNLSYDVKWHHLKDFMRQAGEVLFADVLLLPNGMSKGCGIVEYRSVDDAQRAITTLSNQNLMGRLVYIREDRESEPRYGGGGGSGGGGSNAGQGMKSRGDRGYVVVGDLPEGTTWRELKNFFLSSQNIPVENVGFVDAMTHTCTVELQPQYVTQFIEAFNNIVYNGKTQIRVERSGPPAMNMSGGGGAGGAGGGYDGGQYRPDNFGMMRQPYVAANTVSNPLTEHVTSGGEPTTKIFVGNLPWATTSEDLHELFATIGQVDDADIVRNRGGRPCGSGVVQFSTIDEATDAIKRFDGYSYGKRPLYLSFAKYQLPNAPLGQMNVGMYNTMPQ